PVSRRHPSKPVRHLPDARRRRLTLAASFRAMRRADRRLPPRRSRRFEAADDACREERIQRGPLLLDRRERAALLRSLLRRGDPVLTHALGGFERLAASA